MAVYIGSKKVKELYFGGKKIKEAWYGGKKVYSSLVKATAWLLGEIYQTGDVVFYDGKAYSSRRVHRGDRYYEPGSGMQWTYYWTQLDGVSVQMKPGVPLEYSAVTEYQFSGIYSCQTLEC